MCNRYNLRATKKELVDLFGHLEDDFAPVPDHWPMRPGLVYRPRDDHPGLEGVMLRWGLVPFFATLLAHPHHRRPRREVPNRQQGWSSPRFLAYRGL
jgi:putative SOS response-associated peptidase YedK